MKMSETQVLEYIKDFADRAHGEQVRKYTGERYIGHPVRVMEMVREFNQDIAVLAAALLHDVLEDTPVTVSEMEHSLLSVMEPEQAKNAVLLVIELTDIFVKKDYPRLNRRSRKVREAMRLSGVSAAAQSIKYADIIDNVTDIVKQDTDFAKVFVQEAKRLMIAMTAGDLQLRERALKTVEECLQDLRKPATLY